MIVIDIFAIIVVVIFGIGIVSFMVWLLMSALIDSIRERDWLAVGVIVMVILFILSVFYLDFKPTVLGK